MWLLQLFDYVRQYSELKHLLFTVSLYCALFNTVFISYILSIIISLVSLLRTLGPLLQHPPPPSRTSYCLRSLFSVFVSIVSWGCELVVDSLYNALVLLKWAKIGMARVMFLTDSTLMISIHFCDNLVSYIWLIPEIIVAMSSTTLSSVCSFVSF